jgi:hypothetical protein
MRLPVAALICLTGCVDYDETLREQIDPYIGKTMAQFMRDTGAIPYDYFESAEGRTFLVSERGCDLQLTNSRADDRALADSWIIKSISARGYC